MANPQADISVGAQGEALGRFDALLEALSLAIAVFDGDQRLVTANARYRELTGLDAAQLKQRPVYDAFPNALADLTEQIDDAIDGMPTIALHVPFQLKSGVRLVEVTMTPLADANGVKGLLFAGNDVTERESLREDLARSIAQLESIFDVIPDSVRVVDPEGRTLRSNTQSQQDHGAVQPATLQELWQLDRPRTLEGTSLFVHEHPTARALKGERVRGEQIEVRRGPEGRTIIEVNANPLYDERGRVRGAVTVERDVTFRVKMSQQLAEEARRNAELYERVSTEAERLERMVQERTAEVLALQEARSRERRLAAVGQLAAGVMHDVNNALNPIMAAAYLLEANAENPTAVRDYAVRIAKAAETGAATAARVGRFIRQDPLQGVREEIVDLTMMVDEVIAMTRPLWQERSRGGVVELDRQLTSGAIVSGVAGEVREALLNLVQNALDAMQGGGTLRVKTAVHGEQVSLEVSDTGHGMSAEVRERAFEPFFTTKGQRGTGLGLAEVYGIAKRHRGHAEIESEPGQGTTIRMIFPLSTASERGGDPERPRPRAPRRILFVEDHTDSREFVTALLQTEGHTVTAVTSVQEAREQLDGPTRYEVLITDIGLPDGTGWDLVAYTRARFATMRIGVVTGWEPRSGMGSEADFILRKPVRTSELLGHVVADVA